MQTIKHIRVSVGLKSKARRNRVASINHSVDIRDSNSLASSSRYPNKLQSSNQSSDMKPDNSICTLNSMGSVTSTRIHSSDQSQSNVKKSKGIGRWWILFCTIVISMAIILGSILGIYALASAFLRTASNPDTTTSTMTTTTTTQTPIVNITKPGDPIIGICGTFAGGSTGGVNLSYIATETSSKAIDGLISTKYYNSASSASGCPASNPGGINTGFFVTPTLSNSSIAVAILFITGNDVPNRDPITMTLEGSNETNTLNLHMGTSWTLIYNGSTGFNASYNPGRHAYGTQQNFSNTMSFASYRLLITSRRGFDRGVQYSEVQILGYL